VSHSKSLGDQPVVTRLEDFDKNSGWWIEQMLFNHRGIVMCVCLLLTLGLGYSATRSKLNASFEKTIPTRHPYIANYLKHKSDLGTLGNTVRVTVATESGTIYDKTYMETLQKINDEIFVLPGVDRTGLKSLWTPSTQWRGVTEEGFESGPVMPDSYDGSPASLEQVKRNVERSGEIGTLVSPNYQSSIIFIPLLSTDPETGKPLDYGKFSEKLEEIRSRYASGPIKIHITGFAKVQGDLIAGLRWFLLFFIVAILIDAGLRQMYIRCMRATLLMVVCSLIAVLWQLGVLPLLHYELNPYSILVPFLIFSIGMSHGSQKLNGVMQDIGRGTHPVVAARYTFRRLFLPGLTALLADAVGFIVLMLIRIDVIRELAVMSSVGVAFLILTNLILLPIFLSYTGVSASAAENSLKTEVAERAGERRAAIWRFLDLFTQKKWATIAVCCAVLLAMIGMVGRRGLKIGDLDPGAPELRKSSRYNQDNAYLTANYGASSDVLAVMVETPDGACSLHDTLQRVDALEWNLRQVEGVESTDSLALLNRRVYIGYNEGSMKWYDLPRNQDMINTITARAPRGLYNDSCNLLTLSVYLKDHKADTLTRVVNQVERFSGANQTENARFILGAGTSGIDAATNIVVAKASVAVLPLMLTSVLCEALMAWLGMGVKVATLPVTALGVGIGVDYALYMLSVMLHHMKEGKSLSEAYYATLCFTGRIVILTGLTLAFGVATWAFSPIKFQADIGILLVFMFVWNMLGAMILLPALAYFLLPQQSQSAALKAKEEQAAVLA
jgi:predicted RND superfamily exporter protein